MTDSEHPASAVPIARPVDDGSDVETRVEAIVSAHAATLQRIAAARVGPAVADDVVAETFTAAWVQLSDGRSIDDVDRAWLVGILLNRCRMHHRAERRWRRRQLRGQALQDAGADRTGGISSVPPRVDAQQLAPQLLRAFARLSEPERTAMTLVVWGELSPTEAASAMEIPAATVRSHLRRARQRLGDAIETPAGSNPSSPREDAT